MFVYNSDLVPFNVLPNLNIFQERGFTVTVGSDLDFFANKGVTCIIGDLNARLCALEDTI